MTIYLWLVIQGIIISCVNSICIQQANGHLEYLLAIGSVELLFEIAGIIRIYGKRSDNGK
jgi:hypothetical protein